MSNSKALIPWLEGVVVDIEKSASDLNGKLLDLKLNKIDLLKYIISLKQQIKSANNKFTMAFVGEFKTGKSTIINSLLNLSGDKGLSNCDDPDTAKCIRIMKKDSGMDYEAEIIYESGSYKNEKMSWMEAKRYTSQVSLDNDPSLKEKASKIEEVRYYIDNEFLSVCNILDLPGTGAGGHSGDHNLVTYKKIDEAEVIFWIVSTVDEPGKAAIENLDRFKSKIIPIINVWKDSKNDIESDFTGEDVKKILMEKYSTYFSDVQEPIIYYAKEICNAQENDEDLQEEWGKSAFFECLNKLLSADVVDLEKDRITRIKKQIDSVLTKIIKELRDVNENIEDIKNKNEQDDTEITLLETKLNTIQRSADAKLKEQTKTTSDEMVSYMSSMTDVFIEDQMDSIHLDTVIRMIGKKRKKELEEELKDSYLNKYLKMNEKPCWYQDMLVSYGDNINILLNSEYAIFKIESKKMQNIKDLDIDKNFVDSILKQTMASFVESLGPIIATIIFAIVLHCLPGGAIIDNIAVALMGGNAFKSKDRITKRKDNIKSRARLSISMQKYSIQNQLLQETRKINSHCKEIIIETINKKRNNVESTSQKVMDVKSHVDNFINILDLYIEQSLDF